nr:MAG TPA: repressor protein [Caudoviricetes sp.]
METLEKFPERLKGIIGERDVTLRELVKRIGVSLGILSDWQNGNKKPKVESVIKLATYFNVSTDYLLGLTDVRSVDDSVQAVARKTGLSENAIDILSKMSQSDIDKLSKLIEFYNTIK